VLFTLQKGTALVDFYHNIWYFSKNKNHTLNSFKMKKTLLLLLILVTCMSCKKDVGALPLTHHDYVDTANHHYPARIPGSHPITNPPTLTISKDVNDYNDHVFQGQINATTVNVVLSKVGVTAQGSDITTNRLPVHIQVTNSGSGATNAGAVIITLRLYNSAGVQLDSQPVPMSANPQVVFQNLKLMTLKGTTQVLTIKGDLSPIDGTIVTNGASVRINVSSTDVAAIQAYDANNNVLTGTNILIGSTTGWNVTFYTNGIQVTSNGSGTATASPITGSQTHNVLGFTIPFSVTAFGQNAYIPSLAKASSSATATNAIQFSIDNANGANQAVGTGVIAYAGSDNLTVDANGNYMIPVGQTKNFTLQITYTANGAASYRASLGNVNWNLTDSGSDYSIFTAGLNSNTFRTPYVVAQ
jgi:hypothetical protein